MSNSKKAYKLEDIPQATRYNEPLNPFHEFFTDFSGFRGEFEESIIYKSLGTKKVGDSYELPNEPLTHKKIIFLGGMRGSGKTSELAKYAYKLENNNGFFCVTCNIDVDLDINDLEYMDILILQLENLTKKLDIKGVEVDNGIINAMNNWFQERENEIKNTLKAEMGVETEIKAETPIWFPLLKILGKFKTGISGSHERVAAIRTVLKNNFNRFESLFNEFIEEANLKLRQQNIGREILFIIDGLEKTLSAETRRRIIVDEQNRIEKIKAFTIFTLPIELLNRRQYLSRFAQVEVFPYIKIIDINNEDVKPAYQKFKEFLLKRIAEQLFENDDIITKIIKFSGGSPRQLLMICSNIYPNAKDDDQKITAEVVDKVLKKMSNDKASLITKQMFEKIKEINHCVLKGEKPLYDEVLQKLLEEDYVFEYNSGTYKRVNPILELSDHFMKHVS
jgi:hypothetical protein